MKAKTNRNEANRRTIAAAINQTVVGPVLTPSTAARLLKNCDDPLATLSFALQLFGGLHPAEVESIKWRSFVVPGYVDTYRVRHRNGIQVQSFHSVQVLAVLEDWLEPFALRTDMLCFDEGVRSHAAEALREAGIENAATLRHTYLAYALPQIARVSDWALYCNVDQEEIQDRLFPSINMDDIRRMRTLTPKKVGIKDWPARVGSFMKSVPTGS